MSLLRNATATILAGSAQALSLTSKLLEATARTLRPDSPRREVAPSPPLGTEAVVEEVGGGATGRGRVSSPPDTPVLDESPHLRTSESHIEELAAKPAADVIAAVSGLSTDELRGLTEYEMQHKNRRTVLAAIERALAPGNGGSSPPAGDREIVLPEAGGVPTSGKLDRPR